MSVTYEVGATKVVAEVLEMSRGGLFIHASPPVRAGTLLELEIHIVGEPSPIFAVGRVVWTRELARDAQGRPAGMGVRFVDLDDSSRELIARLVGGRQPTLYGIVDTQTIEIREVRPPEPSLAFWLVTKKEPGAPRAAPESDG